MRSPLWTLSYFWLTSKYYSGQHRNMITLQTYCISICPILTYPVHTWDPCHLLLSLLVGWNKLEMYQYHLELHLSLAHLWSLNFRIEIICWSLFIDILEPLVMFNAIFFFLSRFIGFFNAYLTFRFRSYQKGWRRGHSSWSKKSLVVFCKVLGR